MVSKNKKILLIQPRHGVWDGVFIRFPESVLSIAALPHAKGYDVTILDLRVTPRWEAVLQSYLADNKPICVGITSLTGPSLKDLLKSVEIIKEHDNSIPIVFGGVHATLLPEQSLHTVPGVDVVVTYEGDYSFFEVVKVFEKNNLDEVMKSNALASVKGIYYRKSNVAEFQHSQDSLAPIYEWKGRAMTLKSFPLVVDIDLPVTVTGTKSSDNNIEIAFTGDSPLIMDLDELPDTPYELLDLSKYDAADLGNGVSASFQTSRGCPFACKFCGNEFLQKRTMRCISIPKLVAKIKMLQTKYGYNSFVFVDDLTLAGRKQFIEFCSALKEIRPKIAWTSTGIRANLISKLDEDDVQLLWDSGCRSLDIGIESGSARLLEHITKADTKENMLKANKIIATLPFKTKYTFIVGYPTETDEERNETVDFYLQLQKDNPHIFPMFFVFLPIAGTELYKDVVAAGFKEPTSIQEWVDMDSTSWFYKHDNWIPNSKRREVSMIMISSLFCSKSAKSKMTNFWAKIAFTLYHPIAKMRFKHKFFKLPIESYLVSFIQKLIPGY